MIVCSCRKELLYNLPLEDAFQNKEAKWPLLMVVIFCFLRLLPPPVVVHVAGNLPLTPRLCILHTSKEAGTSSMGSKVSEAGNRCTRCVGRVSLSDQTRTPPILQQPISFLKPHKNSNTSCMSLSPVLFKRRCAIPCLPIGAMAKERWGGGVLNSLKVVSMAPLRPTHRPHGLSPLSTHFGQNKATATRWQLALQ